MEKRETVLESLKFRYKGLLQSVEVQITTVLQSDGTRLSYCEAKLKLPILKKNYFTWTLFSTEDHKWRYHAPVFESSLETSDKNTLKEIVDRISNIKLQELSEKAQSEAERSSFSPVVTRARYSEESEDPIGFFLKIHRGEWQGDSVNLVIGGREVTLALIYEKNQIIVSRPEKNQKLIIKMGDQGIATLEIPIPVVGRLSVERVL